jgi:hypothetical protein
VSGAGELTDPKAFKSAKKKLDETEKYKDPRQPKKDGNPTDE